MSTENKDGQTTVTTAAPQTPPATPAQPEWIGARAPRETPTVPLPVYTRDRSRAEHRGIRKGVEQGQKDLLGRFQVQSADELAQLVDQARKLGQQPAATTPAAAVPAQPAAPAAPAPVQGARESDAVFEARLLAFEKKQQEWEAKIAAQEAAHEERWAKIQAQEEARLAAEAAAAEEAEAEEAYASEWDRWERHASDLKVPAKNQPLLRAYAERFVSNIDPAVEAEFESVAENDDAGLRKLWEKHFYDPLRPEYPFLFAEAQAATTGAVGGGSPPPSPAAASRQQVSQQVGERIGNLPPNEYQAQKLNMLRKLGIAPG